MTMTNCLIALGHRPITIYSVCVSCSILYYIAGYLCVSCSGLITSVWEERAYLSAIMWFLFGEVSSSSW